MAATPPTLPAPVIARPPDNLGGNVVNVGSNPGDLQAAINAARPGDTLICPVGAVYQGRITLPVRTDTGWVCVRVANDATNLPQGQRVGPDGSKMFKIVSNGVTDDGVALNIPATTQGWRFIGLEMTHPNDNHQYGICNVSGSRISFERCYVHGRPLASDNIRGFFVNGSNVQFWDSWFSEWNSINTDAQTIFFQQGGPFHVENCELQATGENIMLGDQGSTAAAVDVTLARNHFFKPLRWRITLANGQPNPSWDGMHWGIKELFEIKRARRVLLVGNTLENNWGGQGQDGTASLATSDSGSVGFNTQDITYRSNTYMNCPSMFSIQTAGGTPVISRVAYLNNLGLNIGSWLVFFNHASEDIWVEHNTIVPQDGVASVEPGSSRLSILWSDPIDWARQTILRNVIGPSIYGLFLDGHGNMTDALANQFLPDRTWAENAMYGPIGVPLTGFTSYPSAAAAGVDLSTGHLISGSPLVGAGSDGKDLGVDFVMLAADQQGMVPPPPPPGANMSTISAAVSGQTVTLTVHNTNLNAHDWVAIWPVGAPDDMTQVVTTPTYLNGTTTPPASAIADATVVFNSVPFGGPYEARFYAGGSAASPTTRLAASASFTVSAPPPPPPLPAPDITITTRTGLKISLNGQIINT